MPESFELLKNEIEKIKSVKSDKLTRNFYMYSGYGPFLGAPVTLARANAAKELFERHYKHVYENDLIAGSLFGLFRYEPEMSEYEAVAEETVKSFGSNKFWTGADHFAPDYAEFLRLGVGGMINKINNAREKFNGDEKKTIFLESAGIAMRAFGNMVRQYGEASAKLSERITDKTSKSNLNTIAKNCGRLRNEPPRTFREALQLVWLAHTAFLYEGRHAMAFGRMDQFLYPFYINDKNNGTLGDGQVLDLLKSVFIKIGERAMLGSDDVVNICVGGVKRDGSCAVNELSYLILDAVRQCEIPGPNLSARISDSTPDKFLDACLVSIGTGLGYPALMNDAVNIPALLRRGYSPEDCRDYCMVGCIENFIAGRQPPWSDGRFNTPKYIELAMNNGRCMLTGSAEGPATGAAESFGSIAEFDDAVGEQMRYGAARYMSFFLNESDRYNRERYEQPFLSCFCGDCVERGTDINSGGAFYPSAHGVACMGVGTFSDSMAAIEKLVFTDKICSLAELRDAMKKNFDGYGELRAACLKAPKYGNNDDRADKYAVGFVERTERLFAKYRTADGGPVYTAMAANIQNIDAGKLLAASPDGRNAREPLSDAASPTYGMDANGPTAVVNSVTKPDYTLVSCGTVLNQKYSAEMFANEEKRAKLLALIKVYFEKGGQEIQINAVGKKILREAALRPEQYRGLIVRVSGFSARFTELSPEVQQDILNRTEHE